MLYNSTLNYSSIHNTQYAYIKANSRKNHKVFFQSVDSV